MKMHVCVCVMSLHGAMAEKEMKKKEEWKKKKGRKNTVPDHLAPQMIPYARSCLQAYPENRCVNARTW